MNVRALAIYLGKTLRVGTLLQYEMPGAETITRFVADDAFARMRDAPVLSARFLAPARQDQAALSWPALIEQSLLTDLQRSKLTAYFRSHPWITALDARRESKAGAGVA